MKVSTTEKLTRFEDAHTVNRSPMLSTGFFTLSWQEKRGSGAPNPVVVVVAIEVAVVTGARTTGLVVGGVLVVTVFGAAGALIAVVVDAAKAAVVVVDANSVLVVVDGTSAVVVGSTEGARDSERPLSLPQLTSMDTIPANTQTRRTGDPGHTTSCRFMVAFR